MSLALPSVRQSGQTQLPARSKLPRKFGNDMHQQSSLPGAAPQLKLVPHASHTRLSMIPPSPIFYMPPVLYMTSLWCRSRKVKSTVSDRMPKTWQAQKMPADSLQNLSDKTLFDFGAFLSRYWRCWAISLGLSPLPVFWTYGKWISCGHNEMAEVTNLKSSDFNAFQSQVSASLPPPQ